MRIHRRGRLSPREPTPPRVPDATAVPTLGGISPPHPGPGGFGAPSLSGSLPPGLSGQKGGRTPHSQALPGSAGAVRAVLGKESKHLGLGPIAPRPGPSPFPSRPGPGCREAARHPHLSLNVPAPWGLLAAADPWGDPARKCTPGFPQGVWRCPQAPGICPCASQGPRGGSLGSLEHTGGRGRREWGLQAAHSSSRPSASGPLLGSHPPPSSRLGPGLAARWRCGPECSVVLSRNRVSRRKEGGTKPKANANCRGNTHDRQNAQPVHKNRVCPFLGRRPPCSRDPHPSPKARCAPVAGRGQPPLSRARNRLF